MDLQVYFIVLPVNIIGYHITFQIESYWLQIPTILLEAFSEMQIINIDTCNKFSAPNLTPWNVGITTTHCKEH